VRKANPRRWRISRFTQGPASNSGRFPVRLYLARPRTAPPRASDDHRPELQLTRGSDAQMVVRPPLSCLFSLLTVMVAHVMRDELRGRVGEGALCGRPGLDRGLGWLDVARASQDRCALPAMDLARAVTDPRVTDHRAQVVSATEKHNSSTRSHRQMGPALR
jgi:hypothetical protein